VRDAPARPLLCVRDVLAKVRAAAVVACKAQDVFVEVDAGGGLPGFQLVGLGSGAVRESGVRVRSALLHSGWKLPAKKLIVNLAPADLRKECADSARRDRWARLDG
jgi:magnesium chelatase family protein